MVRILAVLAALSFSPAVVAAHRSQVLICGSGERMTCVVDGDTLWFRGTKYRLEDIDTPEKGKLAECMQEGLQAIAATRRLAELLSSDEFRIVSAGRMDRYGRVLARVPINERSVGAILVEEGLARPWRGRSEDWCK